MIPLTLDLEEKGLLGLTGTFAQSSYSNRLQILTPDVMASLWRAHHESGLSLILCLSL